MANQAWTGLTLVLSAVGLIVAVAEDEGTLAEARADRSSRTAAKPDEKPAVPDRAVAVLHHTRGNKVRGVVMLTQTSAGVQLKGDIVGLTPGKHGFHIHEYGDLRSADGKSAGGHFNPDGHRHGSPRDAEHHAGDLGNITANSDGVAKVDVLAKGLKLHFVVGRALVVHGGEDDLKSQPSGDAGSRVALGVIGFAGPDKS